MAVTPENAGQQRSDQAGGREVSMEQGALEEGSVAEPSVSLGVTSRATFKSESVVLFFPAGFLMVRKNYFCVFGEVSIEPLENEMKQN